MAKTLRLAWMPAFLAALAETSNVARAAKLAGVAGSTVYDARRKNRTFAEGWREALCEGYDNLEMELLGRLREGEIKRAAGAKLGVRTFDNATSFRLLAVHREAVLKEKGAARQRQRGRGARLDRTQGGGAEGASAGARGGGGRARSRPRR